MTYQAKIIADSIGLNKVRITTFEITFPRIVLSEFNTHRDFSRNSASSRAIPVEKIINAVQTNPYVPEFTRAQRGMVGEENTDSAWQHEQACKWLEARDNAVKTAQSLLDAGVHKGEANRLLEPFMWHTVIVTATRWSNFFALRCAPDAHPAIRTIACMMHTLYQNNTPEFVFPGFWHLPYVSAEEKQCAFTNTELALISAGRCAAVSYLRHGEGKSVDDSMTLAKKLTENGHMSPLEHQAEAMDDANAGYQSGNLTGWIQFRKMLKGECR